MLFLQHRTFYNRLEGDDISMSAVMAPLWAVDLVLIFAPVAMAVAVAARRSHDGEPKAMLVRRQTIDLSKRTKKPNKNQTKTRQNNNTKQN